MNAPDKPDATTVFQTPGPTVAAVDGDPDGLTLFDGDTDGCWLSMRDPINLREIA
jgi:hypothetical protein